MFKKIISFLLALSMVFAISACNNEGKTDKGDKPKKPSSSQSSDTNQDNSNINSGTTSEDSPNVDSNTGSPNVDSNTGSPNVDSNTGSLGDINLNNPSNLDENSSVSEVTGMLIGNRRPDKPSSGSSLNDKKEPQNSQPAPKYTGKWTSKETGYTYDCVWRSEFEENDIEKNKWKYDPSMVPGDSRVWMMTHRDDENVVGVKDGMLQMNGVRYTSLTNPQIEYATSEWLTTRETMNFRYGYVEMRGKVPLRSGAFTSFWAQGKPGLIAKKHDYFVEIDFWEGFGNSNNIIPNFHKWYDNGSHSNFDMSVSEKYGTSIFETKYGIQSIGGDPIVAEEFHIYGFEWTTKYMKVYFDGNCYCTFDIQNDHSYDQDWPKEQATNWSGTIEMPESKKKMTGFHEYIFLRFQNGLFIEGSDTDGRYINADTEFPLAFHVDYVRLYQDPTNTLSNLIYLNEQGVKTYYYPDRPLYNEAYY